MEKRERESGGLEDVLQIIFISLYINPLRFGIHLFPSNLYHRHSANSMYSFGKTAVILVSFRYSFVIRRVIIRSLSLFVALHAVSVCRFLYLFFRLVFGFYFQVQFGFDDIHVVTYHH